MPSPVDREECRAQHADLATWLRRIEDGQIRQEGKMDAMLLGQSTNSQRLAALEAARDTSRGLWALILAAAGLVGAAVSWLVTTFRGA